jgi:RNA polymerase sigma factor (sigma-70 family)
MSLNKNEFVKLVEEHSRMIYKISGAYAKTTCEREDLISETVLQLWRTSVNFKGESKISTWVYRVALNTAMNFNRKHKKETLFLPTDFGATDHFKNLIEAEPTPEFEILYQCIDELDEINKAIILLYLDGNPHEGIAEIIGMSKTNVGTRIGRIKEQLKKSANSKI